MSFDTAQTILDAAESRIADYGYNKTTMADIARDCHMSVGNLYRFFPNKSAIAAGMLSRNLKTKLKVGLQAASRETMLFGRLQAFMIHRLRFAHQYFSSCRHLHECVSMIAAEHKNILEEAERTIIETLAGMLKDGIEKKQIRPVDPRRTAYLIHQACMRYNYPISLKNNDLETLEADLRDTLKLFFEGLSC